MAKKTASLLPSTDELLRQLGNRLRLARLRRRLLAKQVAERAGMAPMTLRSLERGGSGVTMGAYVAVMQVLGIEKDLDLLGHADPVGRELQDVQMSAHPKTTRPSVLPSTTRLVSVKRLEQTANAAAALQPAIASSPQKSKRLRKPSLDARDWIKKSGFASVDALVDLIKPLAPVKKKVR